jgi:O-antigen/teichoic acid export membrane protein
MVFSKPFRWRPVWPQYLTFSPFDTRTEVGRAKERTRRAIITAITNAGELTSAMILALMSVLVALPYLGTERFGIWMTVASFTAALSFLDFGIGNALITRIAAAAASERPSETVQAVTGGLGLMFLVGCLSSLMLALTALKLPWDQVVPSLSTNYTLLAEIRQTGTIFGVSFGVYLFSAAIKKVYLGLQLAYIGHATSIIFNCLAFVFLIFAAGQRASVPVLLAITFALPSIGPLALLQPLRVKYRFLQPPLLISAVVREAGGLARVGGMFAVIQFGVLIHTASEMPLIAFFVGPTAVALYSVSQRFYQYCLLPIRLLSGALWGGYADAYTRGDRHFLGKALKKQTALACLFVSLLVFPLAFTQNVLVRLWTSGSINVPTNLTVVLAAWATLDAVTIPLAIFMNGCGKLRPQVAASIFLLFTQFPAKVFALATYGLTAMVIMSVCFQALAVLLFFFVIYREDIFEPLTESGNLTKPNP